MTTTFKQISVNDLLLNHPARIARDIEIFPPTTLSIPPIEFGDTSPDDVDVLDKDAIAGWAAAPLNIGEVHAFRLKDAIVHPPYGVVTLDQLVLRETLGHLPFHRPGYFQEGEEVGFPLAAKTMKVEEAISLLGGNSSNYFHFMLEILVKLQMQPFSSHSYQGPILFPQVETAAQRDVLTLLGAGPNPVLVLGQDHSVQVESLLFIPNLVGYGYAPNPNIRYFFDQLKSELGVSAVPTRRIYIARADSTNRLMTNESDVIAMVQKYGFEIVALTGLSLADQARLFASASHVIAPHGAGLTNIVFCNEGTTLCELQMSAYIRWFFRSLAGIRNMRYGCLIGQIDADSHSTGWPHSMRWSTPLDRLRCVLDDPGFLNGNRSLIAHPATIATATTYDAFATLRQPTPVRASPIQLPVSRWLGRILRPRPLR